MSPLSQLQNKGKERIKKQFKRMEEQDERGGGRGKKMKMNE